MSSPQETYLAHLATMGVDASTIAVDAKGTLSAAEAQGTLAADGQGTLAGAAPSTLPPSADESDVPRPTSRLPRLLVAHAEAQVDDPDLALEDRLGKGGMGVVWSATQVALRRRVAVKRLLDERVGAAAEEQLLREALVTGALEHPNIVPVHALGRDDDGRPVLVMKRIEGTPWSEGLRPLYARDREPDPREVDRQLGILMQVCQALEFAHAQGVVHRDIKPDNVMIGSFGEVYLLDWGIAVDVQRSDGPLPTLQPGKLMGTPGYMAPEMAAADIDQIDARTDVYLLGATLHQLVTGQPRHVADGIFAILAAAFESEPYEYPEWVPQELAEICNRATHKDRQRRYPSAGALREALVEFSRHGSSRELAAAGWQKLAYLQDLLGGDIRTVTADAIQIHALASEARFAFERARQQWPGNREARRGLQELLELMIRYELGNGNVRSATGLLASLPEPRPALQREVEEAAQQQLARREEIARMERARFEADIDVFKGARRRLSFLHGITLALLAAGLFALRMLGLHQPGYPDAIVVCVILSGVVVLGRRRAMARSRTNEVNRKLFDSILGSVLFVALVFVVGHFGDVPFPAGLAMAMVVAAATCGMMVVFFDRRLWWTALGFSLTAAAIVAWPALRGLWIALGGMVSFGLSAMVWREIEEGRHPSQRREAPAESAASPK